MLQSSTRAQFAETTYPTSDGKPMAENTLQFEWIVLIKENCERLFADRPDVFVAGDLLWYPVEGHNTLCLAPDTMVAFGRPKGYRGSYQQWNEADIAPQVVFEILSPGNRLKEMAKKFEFYQTYGVEEYYLYDPDRNDLTGWLVGNDGYFRAIEGIDQWTSPRLGVQFCFDEGPLTLYGPDQKKFLSFTEISQQADQETQRADQETQRADQETQRADREAQRADREAQRVEQLMAQLRSLGVDPNLS